MLSALTSKQLASNFRLTRIPVLVPNKRHVFLWQVWNEKKIHEFGTPLTVTF